MKEYKNSRVANFADVLVSWIFTLLIGCTFAFFTKQDMLGWIGRACFFGIIMDFTVLRKHLKRRVTINPASVVFKSYHIESGYRDAEINFSSIERLGKTFYPNLKGMAMTIRVDGLKKDILIDATMENHKELFSEICKRTKQCNPNVKISKKIIEYLSDE